MAERFEIAIVGSGPSGLSAAAHAAELGVAHVLLESERHPGGHDLQVPEGQVRDGGARRAAAAQPDVVRGRNARGDPRRMGHRDRQVQGEPARGRRRHGDHRGEGRFRAEARQRYDRRGGSRDPRHRAAGQPAQARRPGRRPAGRPVPARRSGRIFGRNHRHRRRRRRRDRECAGARRAEPRHPHQSQRGIRALQGRQPRARAGGDQGRPHRVPVPDEGARRRDGRDRRLPGPLQRDDDRRHRGDRMPPRHRTAGGDSAAQARRILRRRRFRTATRRRFRSFPTRTSPMFPASTSSARSAATR